MTEYLQLPEQFRLINEPFTFLLVFGVVYTLIIGVMAVYVLRDWAREPGSTEGTPGKKPHSS